MVRPKLMALAVLLICACEPPRPRDGAANGASNGAANAVAPDAEVSNAASAAPRSNWEYRTERDEVRNADIRFARIASSNTVHFSPPYEGGSQAVMTIRRHPEYGLDIIFSVDPSQMVCDLSYGCPAPINVDGAQHRLTLRMPADYSHDHLFVSSPGTLLARLRGSRRLIVELPFYNEGNRQFTFDTTGLQWPDEGSRRSGSGKGKGR